MSPLEHKAWQWICQRGFNPKTRKMRATRSQIQDKFELSWQATTLLLDGLVDRGSLELVFDGAGHYRGRGLQCKSDNYSSDCPFEGYEPQEEFQSFMDKSRRRRRSGILPSRAYDAPDAGDALAPAGPGMRGHAPGQARGQVRARFASNLQTKLCVTNSSQPPLSGGTVQSSEIPPEFPGFFETELLKEAAEAATRPKAKRKHPRDWNASDLAKYFKNQLELIRPQDPASTNVAGLASNFRDWLTVAAPEDIKIAIDRFVENPPQDFDGPAWKLFLNRRNRYMKLAGKAAAAKQMEDDRFDRSVWKP